MGLDPLMQARFFELLRSENRRGMTVFYSSHTLSDVQMLKAGGNHQGRQDHQCGRDRNSQKEATEESIHRIRKRGGNLTGLSGIENIPIASAGR